MKMRKPETVNGMNKQEYVWSRKHNLTIFLEGVPETEEQIEDEWKAGLAHERYCAAKKADKPKFMAEYLECVRKNNLKWRRGDAAI
jgi:hypothetical protein